MNLAEAFKALLVPSTSSRDVPTPILGDYFVNQTTGLLDPEQITFQEFAQAFRSMTAMLMRFRSQNFAPFLARATVEASTDKAEDDWQAVDPLHPYQVLLDNPNPLMDPLDFWTFTSLQRDGQGHADFMVDSITTTLAGQQVKVPIALYPIYPEYGYMVPLMDERAAIKAWKYYRNDGSQPWLDPTDVVRIKRIHPVSAWRTAGLIEANAYELDSEQAGNVYTRDHLRDAGQPPVILETDKTVNQGNVSTYRQIAKDFARQFRAGSRRHQTPISHSGLGIRELTAMEGDDYVKIRQFLRQTLWHVWETHEGLFAKDATRANAEAAFWSFSLLTAKPNVESMARCFLQEMRRIFADALGPDQPEYRLNVGQVVPIDEERQAKIDASHVTSGLRTINEIRGRDGLLPIEGGDKALVAGNLITLESAMRTGL